MGFENGKAGPVARDSAARRRVALTKPEYWRSWLLHTATEPRLRIDAFSAVHESGRLFCQTLLPEGARIIKVGGPGRQFWSGGRNWALPLSYPDPDTTPLFGQWRVEVFPKDQRREDFFLHLIQVSDAAVTRMADCDLPRRHEQVGLRFQAAGADWEIEFGTEGRASGHIKCTRAKKITIDRRFSTEVAPQSGLYGASRTSTLRSVGGMPTIGSPSGRRPATDAPKPTRGSEFNVTHRSRP